jgi:hypothetical protein
MMALRSFEDWSGHLCLSWAWPPLASFVGSSGFSANHRRGALASAAQIRIPMRLVAASVALSLIGGRRTDRDLLL